MQKVYNKQKFRQTPKVVLAYFQMFLQMKQNEIKQLIKQDCQKHLEQLRERWRRGVSAVQPTVSHKISVLTSGKTSDLQSRIVVAKIILHNSMLFIYIRINRTCVVLLLQQNTAMRFLNCLKMSQKAFFQILK